MELFIKSNFIIKNITGLTYPISNILLPISNYLVKRKEAANSKLSMIQKTKLSGERKVFLKTYFPNIFLIFLNKITINTFYILQKKFSNSSKCLVFYFEIYR